MSTRAFLSGLLGAFLGHILFAVVFLVFEERVLAVGDWLEKRLQERGVFW